MPKRKAKPRLRRERFASLFRSPAVLSVLLVVLILTAYHNCFGGVFVFDDIPYILHGSRISSALWPPGGVAGGTLRPLLFYSLALNFQLHGLEIAGYHAFNVGVHIAVALTLFGLIRRTLLLAPLRNRCEKSASWVAFAAAAIWAVHPLTTQAVIYTIQRCESMMTLCLLLSLYCVLRGADSKHKWPWYTAAVTACSIGMGCKEVMIVAPVILLLYDRVFLARSFKELLTVRGIVYVAILPATLWLLSSAGKPIFKRMTAEPASIAALVRSSNESPSGDSGPPPQLVSDPARPATDLSTSWEYARSQPTVILHYLRLAFWPNPLCLDYRWPIVPLSKAIVPAIVVFLLVSASFAALWFRPAIGFVATSFFLVLAPTSSILPIKDLAFEHRMYLPLAALILLVVLAIHAFSERVLSGPEWTPRKKQGVACVLLIGALFALSTRTLLRNRDYRSNIAIWQSVVAVVPENPRGHINLAKAYMDGDVPEQAGPHLVRARDLAPDDWTIDANTGRFLTMQGQFTDALSFYARALPHAEFNRIPSVHNDLGAALEKLGRFDEAIAYYAKATQLVPGFAEVHNNLGSLLIETGEFEDGIEACSQALRLRPRFFKARFNLAIAYAGANDFERAIENIDAAIEIEPGNVVARALLATLYASRGRFSDAVDTATEAVRVAESNRERKWVNELHRRLEFYRARKRAPDATGNEIL